MKENLVMVVKLVDKKIPDKLSCHQLLERARWPSEHPKCIYCDSYNITLRERELRYRCNQCDAIFSLLTSTFLHGTRIPLQKWFSAILLIVNSKKPIKRTWLASQLNVNRITANNIIHRIQRSVARDDQFLVHLYDELNKTIQYSSFISYNTSFATHQA